MFSATRRTYKSKKDTIGALDHKDVLLFTDKKSSAFDAFYIENIKQTKRDLSYASSYNQHGTALKKICKRKFIKRVAKKIEPSPQESSSTTTFLTPDKSIRVNKPLDPFDMLLNSPPVCTVATKPISKDYYDNISPRVKKANKCSRKKLIKEKKVDKYLNNTSSDSEKENSICSTNIQNATDIHSYELVIERDLNQPKSCNESIKRIIKSLPVINKQCLSPVFKTPLRYKRNRLTNNINSPFLKTSPLCSTPFKEKYRGQSIYRFSPITGSLSSPNMSVLTDKHTNHNELLVEEEVKTNINTTPGTHIEANTSNNKEYQTDTIITEHHDNIEKLDNKMVTRNICKEFKSSCDTTPNAEIEYATAPKKLFARLQTTDVVGNDSNNYSYVHQIQKCSLDNTEAEPFLGFAGIVNENKSQACVLENAKKNNNKYLLCDDEISNCKDNSSVKSLDNSLESNLTCHDNDTEHKNNNTKNLELLISSVSNASINCNDVSNHNIASDNDRSSYDTCESESEGIVIKRPVVLLNKLNDSIVYKYFKNINEIDTSSKGKTHEFSSSESNDITYSENVSSDPNSITLNDEDENINHLSEKEQSHNNTVDETNGSLKSNSGSDNSKQCSKSNVSDSENSMSLDDENEDICIRSEIKESHNSAIERNNYVLKGNISKSNTIEYSNSCNISNFSECDTNEESNISHRNESSEIINDSYNSQCNSRRNSKSIESNTSSLFSNGDNDSYFLSDINIKSSDEDKHVNFVTTRRKNRTTNSLCMSMNNNSVESNSFSISTECEKTVISNKISFVKDSSTDSTINRLSSNSTCNEDLNKPRTSNANFKKQVRRSSIKARNLRKSRVGNTQHNNVLKIESAKLTDRTDESEDHSNDTLYKIAPNNPANTEDLQLTIVDQSAHFESPRCCSSVKVDTVLSSQETSDSDVITITETDSDDMNTNTMIKYQKSTNVEQDKSKLSDVSDNESKDTITEIIKHSNKYRNTVRYSQFNDRQSTFVTRKSQLRDCNKTMSPKRFTINERDTTHGIVLQPGKKWERSLSIYRRMSMMGDFDISLLDEGSEKKGRKYRESVINTMEMQECKASLCNESINSRRSIFVSKPNRSTISIIKDPDVTRGSLSSSLVFEDLQGFLNDECDDTIIGLSKLSLADAGHEVTVLGLHEKPERGSTARDYVLRRCNQTDTILFDECYPDTVLKNCHKIGEGVYGEVFLFRDRDGRGRVMKIVPVAGTVKVNGEHQKDFQEIISEIVIAMELSALRSPTAAIDRHFEEGKDVDALDLHDFENATDVFNEVLAVRCVYGSYPSRLLDLWELYDECKGSENDNPEILPVDQQYIVLELANAGQDLESYQFNNAEQAHALFLQVAFGLAVGEEAYQFEHRDLHWGNVLIAPTDQKYASFVLRGRCHRVPRCGVAATIIDYSLSRLSCPLGAQGDLAALYNDLSTDEGLFDAVGDYQFEVYRLMRDKLGNDWKNFEPYTNILWLHYTVDKMITALRYKRVNTKIHKHYIEKLKGIKGRLLTYKSAVQFVLTDNEY